MCNLPSVSSLHVLLSVVGLTPQTITETLYAYYRVCSPPIPITRIFALTTRRGLRVISESLLGSTGQIERLRHDYNLPPIQFDESHIHVFTSVDGEELEDIVTAADNEAVANQIFDFVRRLTADANLCLHASIAGGRKTMGVYLGLALQFYGRPGDTLSHVLVNPALESNPQFFYPRPNQPTVRSNDGRLIPARVELAEIPLLQMREKIPFLNTHSEASYTDLIAIAQQEYDWLQAIHPVVISCTMRSLSIDKVTIKLPPLEFALYLYFARKRLSTCATEDCPGCETCSVIQPEVEVLRHILQDELGMRDPRYRLPRWSGAEAIDRFVQTKSKLNAAVRDGLPNNPFARRYQIERLAAFPGWGNARYGIPLDKRLIQIR